MKFFRKTDGAEITETRFEASKITGGMTKDCDIYSGERCFTFEYDMSTCIPLNGFEVIPEAKAFICVSITSEHNCNVEALVPKPTEETEEKWTENEWECNLRLQSWEIEKLLAFLLVSFETAKDLSKIGRAAICN